jgi:hypothetical protein
MIESVSPEEYVQLYEELQALAKAWKDRLDIPEYVASCVLLQVGGTMAAWSGAPLEQTLRLVKSAWETADDLPKGAK